MIRIQSLSQGQWRNFCDKEHGKKVSWRSARDLRLSYVVISLEDDFESVTAVRGTIVMYSDKLITISVSHRKRWTKAFLTRYVKAFGLTKRETERLEKLNLDGNWKNLLSLIVAELIKAFEQQTIWWAWAELLRLINKLPNVVRTVR